MPNPKRKSKKRAPKQTALVIVPRPKSSTGRPCKICNHPSVVKINAMIAKGEKFRRISSHWMAFSDRAVSRHAEKCLRLDLRAVMEENRIAQAVNHFEELRKQLEFSLELQAAAREVLVVEEIGRVSFMPRAVDVDVIYDDPTTLDPITNQPMRRIRSLQAILNQLAGNPDFIRNVQSIVKFADLKDYALKTIAAVDTILDKFARIEGRYKDKADNTETDELKKLRTIIQKRAQDEGITFSQMLPIFVENYAHLYKPELVEKLVSEANN